MLSLKQKYEAEIRIGLLAILFVLVFLNFIALFVIYRARSAKAEDTTLALQTAALAISRAAQETYPRSLGEDELADLKNHHDLDGLFFLPSRPIEDSPEARRAWFVTVARTLPHEDILALAGKLINTEFKQLTRSESDEYFYLYPVPAGAGHSLLIVSKRATDLAYLDDAGQTILWVGLVGVGLVVLVLLVLSRVIYAPFRKIGRQATEAGRLDAAQTGDVDQVVAEYERLISELTDSQAELRELHAEAIRRADSLAQFNEYLQRATDSGLLMLTPEGKPVSVNHAACELLGLSPDEDNLDLATILTEAPELLEFVTECIGSTSLPEYREFSITGYGGRPLRLGLTVSGIRDTHDRRIGLAVMINDLSELHDLRQQLESKNRLAALGEMAGGLAHQLRNAMGVISGYARLLRRRFDKVGESTETADALLAEVAESERLVRQFLSFTRPLELQPMVTSIRALVSECIRSHRIREGETQVEITLAAGADCELRLDPVLFKQVVGNVIDNAAQACTGTGGLVTIRCQSRPDSYLVAIEDTGSGIPEEDLERIFTPFYSSNPAGTGLGLPLVRKIVDLHDGRVEVRSELGRGTSFLIHLPLPALTESATETPSGNPANL